ncbi:MAG: molybdate ABC transporter substrate-binding protein [Armatimonadetes bacterium]|nr:molybdate ABC transporter substrate-binding protein [Armatimonadota bacterium]
MRRLRSGCPLWAPLLALVASGSALILGGCGLRTGSAVTPAAKTKASKLRAGAAELTVAAPQLFKRALDDIHREFQLGHPAARLQLQTSIVDELASAKTENPMAGDVVVVMGGPELAALRDRDPALAGEPAHVANVAVIVAVPRGNPLKLKALKDLARPDVKHIAVADPDRDSSGQAFREALRQANLWEKLQPKLQVAASPHASCEAVEKGRAEAAVTYAPCVLFGHSQSTLGIGLFLPRETVPLVQVVALARGPASEPARAYLDYLRQERAQALWAKYGFEPVAAKPAGESEVSLLVPCGAALQPAMDVIAETYYRRTGVRVDFAYAGAQMLLGQLAYSRRGDLYMPGEAFWVDQAAKRGLVEDTRTVCWFLPVIMVPKGNPKNIQTVQDMAKPGVRVGIGHPKALAVGPVTKRIMQRAGIWEAVQKNVVMQAGCIPELANAVAMKAADAGILWDACAEMVEEHVDIIKIDPRLNEVAEVMLATLKVSQHPEEARKFMEYVASDEAAAIFEERGFRTERPQGVRLAPRDDGGAN